jgi:hypothetical protein
VLEGITVFPLVVSEFVDSYSRSFYYFILLTHQHGLQFWQTLEVLIPH